MVTRQSTDDCPRDPSLVPVMIFATIFFAVDALLLNFVLVTFLVLALLLLIGLPQLFRKRYKRFQRHLLRNFGVFLGSLLLAVVMVNVNARVAPLRAQRLI